MQIRHSNGSNTTLQDTILQRSALNELIISRQKIKT